MINFRWSELSSNSIELLANKVENFLPSCLVGGVLHNVRDYSEFASQIFRKLIDNARDGLMIFVLLENSLEAKTELVEARSKHGGLIRLGLLSVWIVAAWIRLTTENAKSSHSIFLLEVDKTKIIVTQHIDSILK